MFCSTEDCYNIYFLQRYHNSSLAYYVNLHAYSSFIRVNTSTSKKHRLKTEDKCTLLVFTSINTGRMAIYLSSPLVIFLWMRQVEDLPMLDNIRVGREDSSIVNDEISSRSTYKFYVPRRSCLGLTSEEMIRPPHKCISALNCILCCKDYCTILSL